MLKNKKKISAGFTLIELLIVMAILAILATVGLAFFTSAQARGRDTKRKSSLKQISTALELYYSDYETYPGTSNGKILGCPSAGGSVHTCDWGTMGSTSAFTDNVTVYMKIVPADPSGYNYYYRTVIVDTANQGFQLYAHLENSQDPSCLAGSNGSPNCTSPADIPSGVSCGTGVCNFAITSANVTPTQE